MPRRSEKRFCIGHFDDPTQIHDGDTVTDLAHEMEIVSYEQQPETEALLEGPEQVMIWARMETSRAETGSSAMMRSGLNS